MRNTDAVSVAVASPPLFTFCFDLTVIYFYLQKVGD